MWMKFNMFYSFNSLSYVDVRSFNHRQGGLDYVHVGALIHSTMRVLRACHMSVRRASSSWIRISPLVAASTYSITWHLNLGQDRAPRRRRGVVYRIREVEVRPPAPPHLRVVRPGGLLLGVAARV